MARVLPFLPEVSDGSRKRIGIKTEGAFGWGIFGVGLGNKEYWDQQPRSAVKNWLTGGNTDWVADDDVKNTRSEVQHLVAILHLLLPLGLPVLHSCDLEANIDKFNSVCHWGKSEQTGCEDGDLWRAIAHLKREWEKRGVRFAVFHNKGHPERWSSLKRREYSALMQVAVKVDELAEMAMDNKAFQGRQPALPGQSRWSAWHKGKEIVGPVKQVFEFKCKQDYIEQHLRQTRQGTLAAAVELTAWAGIAQFSSHSISTLNRFNISKYLYNWWGTLDAQCKRGSLAGEDASICRCTDSATGASLQEIETQWHLLAVCKVAGLRFIRRKYSLQQKQLFVKYRVSKQATKAIFGNIGVQDDGSYPDISSDAHIWQFPEHLATKAIREGCQLGINWFQRAPLPAKFVAQSKEILGIDVDQAVNLCAQWMALKWKEGMAIWRRRNDIVHKNGNLGGELYELRSKVRVIVLDRRANGISTPPDAVLRRMGRIQLEKFMARDLDSQMRNSILNTGMFMVQTSADSPASTVAANRGRGWFSQENDRNALISSRIRHTRSTTRHQGQQRSVLSMPVMLAAQTPSNVTARISSGTSGTQQSRRFVQSRLSFEVEASDSEL